MSFESMNDDDIKFRTDNIVESYNKKINSYIDCHKPKLSFFVKKYKEMIINIIVII